MAVQLKRVPRVFEIRRRGHGAGEREKQDGTIARIWNGTTTVPSWLTTADVATLLPLNLTKYVYLALTHCQSTFEAGTRELCAGTAPQNARHAACSSQVS